MALIRGFVRRNTRSGVTVSVDRTRALHSFLAHCVRCNMCEASGTWVNLVFRQVGRRRLRREVSDDGRA
jgi:hypothetical protein